MALQKPIAQPNVRILDASDARDHLTEVIDSVSDGVDEVVIERDGAPKIAVISYEEYQDIRARREKERRAWAIAELRKLSAEINERNKDLTQEQVDEIAQRLSRELREERYQAAEQARQQRPSQQ